MGFFDIFSRDPVKSTAAWGAMAFKKFSKNNWQFAEDNKIEIFTAMIQHRQGTPHAVLLDISRGDIDSLSDLCTSIVLSEAISVNSNDIPDIQYKIRTALLSKGIPENLA